MSTDYGNQIYKSGDNHSEDPEKNWRFVARLGNDDSDGHSRFVVPNDKYPLKPDQLLFLLQFEIPSNYVPDNDMPAKMIRKLDVKILENLIFSSFDVYEYFLLNHFLTKLNYSNHAQDTELFFRGRFDHFDIDSSKMLETRVHYNGMNVVENRQLYADEKWVQLQKPMNFANLLNQKVEAKSYVYSFRCPIAHGITRQPKVIPPGSKLEFDITFHSPEHMLMKPSEYREHRIKIFPNSVFDEDELIWTEASDLLMEEHYNFHEVTTDLSDPNKCSCKYDSQAKKMLNVGKDKQYIRLERIIPRLEYDEPRIITNVQHETINDKEPTHYAISLKPKIRRVPVLDENNQKLYDWIYFYKKYDLRTATEDDPETETNEDENRKKIIQRILKKIELESVFCNASKKEMPISLGKKKIKLPIYYPRLTVKTLRSGLATIPIELHCGILPYMIIFSGRSHKAQTAATFERCVTQTSLKEPNFEIVELSIYLNNNRILRTPWNHGLQHYINYIKHTGRYENKTLGGSTDYFQFLDQNWCVPIRFGENEGKEGTVTVEITFSKPIEEGNLWDAFILKIPSANLLLDGNTNGIYLLKFIFF
jgi:hypothetical protein